MSESATAHQRSALRAARADNVDDADSRTQQLGPKIAAHYSAALIGDDLPDLMMERAFTMYAADTRLTHHVVDSQ